ncbi:hypothetical protein LVD15_19365 [Fulvivirga maritima]|uniref:hypothetical protein n=1 Tax=Fulvivirga maritima TaxID=2904247 RepID=UPI001F24EC82|nr:hypothetical protein [Fulvivirga maritima]UII25444.1 hypothetical protein LVD15_19365 [Fulvivirga maritima]
MQSIKKLTKNQGDFLYLMVPDFIYIYASNEDQQDMDVYFDDLKVTHTLGNVVSGADF